MPNNINISGSTLQGTFAVGHQSTSVSTGNQSFQNNQLTGSFEALSQELARHGVTEADIADLRKALEQDKNAPELAHKKNGPKVTEWMQNMFGKAINTIWQVEIGMAGSLLASAIQRYYGWP
ncbi:hypothetical protein [Janthinobacterium agaricidamnosum]|uniref:Uncharacterized protein n=1 Tax=Janthinobacterium agaricidamnosum NBRC 102515 = DSM 9628 TaxID=1349767 RepID=W0V205_9BURK|nr:hypothetical protein [Janthinobacterium agaricidamnosum]CDG81307.1 hypothetical protein GJA_648 [Janthinobacterium agaricidamnosum NBRC 102515 = DSM 9628]